MNKLFQKIKSSLRQIPISCIIPLNLKKILLLKKFKNQHKIIDFIKWVLNSRNIERDIKKFGLMPIDILEVDVSSCYVQRPVICEMIESENKKLIPYLEQFFEVQGDWSIKNSMHYDLYKNYSLDMSQEELMKSSYWKWQANLHENNIDYRDQNWIRIKIEKAFKVFYSIKKKGFRSCDISSIPWVLNTPLCSSRYKYNYRINGYEIYSGHHRIAALRALDVKKVRVILVKDIARKTPFGMNLKKINEEE